MAAFSAFLYALPCTTRAEKYFPARIREGLFLRVEHDDNVGVGEFAPLSGIHRTTIHDAISAAKALDHNEIRRAFCHAVDLSNEERADFFDSFPTLLGQALSMACFHRLMQSAVDEQKGMLKLAALIEVDDAANAIALAQAYAAQGFSHLKIKVGGLPLDEEIRKIKTIAAIAGKRIKLRLDANRRFSFVEVSELLKGLKRVPLEYFEEPTHETTRLIDLHEQFGVTLAIDESLSGVEDIELLVASKVSHLIIKPGRFSNVFATINLVDRARSLGLIPIFSHCFESEFSSSIFALMINALKLNDDAHGIVVDGIFRQGVFAQPLRSFRGQLSIDNAARLCTTSFLKPGGVFTQIV